MFRQNLKRMALVMSALFIFIITAGCGTCLAAERISDEVSNSLELLDAKNFGDVSVVTGETQVDKAKTAQVKVTGEVNAVSTQKKITDDVPKTYSISNPENKALNGNADNKQEKYDVRPVPVSPGANGNLPVSGAGNNYGGKTSAAGVKNDLNPGAPVKDDDLMSKLMPEETFEIMGSSAALNPKAEELFKNATDLFNDKRYIEAKRKFEEAVRLEPKNDVYVLALDMVNNTIKSLGIKDTAPKESAATVSGAQTADTPGSASAVKNVNQPNQAGDKKTQQTASSSNLNGAMNSRQPSSRQPLKRKPRPKIQTFLCTFEGGKPNGNIIFNLGLNTEIKYSDIHGHYVSFDGEKDAMTLAAFKLETDPKKVILLVTSKLNADNNEFNFPLLMKVNNNEIINGAFKLATDFKLYQFDITDIVHNGMNQILFQTSPTKASNYSISRIEIFVQNY